MFATVIHPSAARLQAFALGDEMTNRNQGTRAHLAACARCRAEVVAIRSLDRDVGALAAPTMRSDALARVLEARSRGGRVLLSATDAPTDTPRWARSWKAAVAALLLAIGGLSAVLVRPSSLTAASRNGTLVFAPARPTAGAVVRVSYQAPTDLARWRSLTLRARLRTALDAPYFWTTRQSTIAMLVRGADGLYHGTFTLPRDAVFAAFAVEAPDAHRVDANGGRLWELAVEADGHPTRLALEQWINDLFGRSPDEVLTLARRLSDLFPRDPSAWRFRFAFEAYMLGPDYRDSTLVEHTLRLRQLDGALRAAPYVSPEAMEGLRGYADGLSTGAQSDVSAIGRYWAERLGRDSSHSSVATAFQMTRLASAVNANPTSAMAALDSMESFWQRGDSLVSTNASSFGLQFAQRTGDSAAVLRWVDRAARDRPDEALYRYQQIAADRRFREASRERIRHVIRDLGQRDDSRRALDASIDEDQRAREDLQRIALGMLGESLLQKGDTVAALDTLVRATSDGWGVGLFRLTAHTYWLRHDTTNAGRMYALVASDPGTPPKTLDSLATVFGGLAGRPRWEQWLSLGRREFVRRVLAASTSLVVADSGELLDDQGTSHRLLDLTRGNVSVVVYWSRECGPSRAQLPSYGALRAQLNQHGAHLVLVTEERPSPALRQYFQTAKLDLGSYYDVKGTVKRALSNNATPTYYVLDQTGRVRFVGHTVSQAITQSVALVAED